MKGVMQAVQKFERNETPPQNGSRSEWPSEAGINYVLVVGAGSMGSGIAAHIANAGVRVLLVDVVRPGAGDRDSVAKEAIERQLRFGGFMHPSNAELVEAGNVEDDLRRAADADWIVEAIVEDLDTKRELYRRLEDVRRKGSIVSSNTSTIPLGQLVAGFGERLRSEFFITHFFNPPRIMRLMELVAGDKASAESLTRIEAACDIGLGKSVVRCRDTPGFIANRIGNYWMSVAALEAIKAGLSVEDADAVMGQPFGIPRTGVFGLFDYTGVNLVPLVWGSFMKILPAHDAHRRHDITQNQFISSMLKKGLIGRAGPGGFYRRKGPNGERRDEVIDFETGEYRARKEPRIDSLAKADSLRALCEYDDKGGKYAWTVLSHLVTYSADCASDIAEDVPSIDLALRLGYNWKYGPFELADEVGAGWIVERLRRDGRNVPALLQKAAESGGFYSEHGMALRTDGKVQAETSKRGVLTLAAARSGQPRVDGNASASLWDIGDGIAALEIHTKLNACDYGVVELLERVPEKIATGFVGLVIGSDNLRAFSAGASLDIFIDTIKAGEWKTLSEFVSNGQNALLGLKYGEFPVVAAAHGLALGGGCELLMFADATVAHAELSAGLPERKVGVIPGWGGGTQLFLRWLERLNDPEAAAERTFEIILSAEPGSSALHAREMGILRPSDPIVMNRERLLARAKAHARELAAGYRAPSPVSVKLPGEATLQKSLARLQALVEAKQYSPIDENIARQFAHAMMGRSAGDAAVRSEKESMRREFELFMSLARQPETLARLEHMRATGKPLRN